MCGLIYGRSKSQLRPVNKVVLKQYLRQKSRGTDGFGIYDGRYEKIARETTERRILRWLRKHRSTEILFHHRFPTSTDNTRTSAHPFSTKNHFKPKEYILIHNGVIKNSKELREDHETRGIKYQSIQPDGRFNDSEALLWDIALYLQGIIDEPKAAGSVAFICIEKDNEDPSNNKLHYYHNTGNPLYGKNTNKHFMLSSTGGDGTEFVPVDKLFSYSYSTEKTSEKKLEIKTYTWSTPQIPAYTYPSTGKAFPGDYASDAAREDYGREEAYMEQFETYGDRGDNEKKIELLTDLENLDNDVKERMESYLEEAEGYYEYAVLRIQEDMMAIDEDEYNIENWYEMEVLRRAQRAIAADPFWNTDDENGRHPLFQETDDSSEEQDKAPKQLALPSEVFTSVASERIDSQRSRGASMVADVLRARSEEIKEDLTSVRALSGEVMRASLPGQPGLFDQIPVVGD